MGLKRFLVVFAATSLGLLAGCGPDKPQSSPYAEGSVRGVSVRIPRDEIFILDYARPTGKNESFEGVAKNCRTPLGGVLLFLRWPDLVPITDENRADFERTRWQSLGDSQWMDVGFGNHPKNQNYLGAERDARLYRDSSRVIQLPKGMQMLIEQRNPETGLARGVPVGANSGKHKLWNREVYWRSKHGTEDKVITVISCAAGGRYDPPRWTPRCTHEFSLPDMQMAVRIAYRKNLLPEWQAIEEKVSAHLQGFRMSTCPIRPSQDQ